jgi:8-amino-7-oxononanoate synthase
LVRGSCVEHAELEAFLAHEHGTPAALLFGSGFEANLGLVGSLGGRHDTILYDELVHASMRDGVRHSVARSFSFRHNDLNHLRERLKRRSGSGSCYVLVESVYSMDGDMAPLEDLTAVCEEFSAYLIVDEAHSTGVYGAHGGGLVQALGLADRVFARVHTFGKALGYRGACVVGSTLLREYLVNFARSFVYSTAPDLLSVRIIRRAYERMRAANQARAALTELIQLWGSLVADATDERAHPMPLSESALPQPRSAGVRFLRTSSPIQGVIVPGNEAVLAVEQAVRSAGFDVRALRAPTVAAGSERIRISLHATNTPAELEDLCKCLRAAVRR